MKVALVHDYLNQYGGAERVLEEFHEIWPDAPIFVAIHDPNKMPAGFRDWDIRASKLNRIPLANRKHQALLPFYPAAFESFDLSGFDLVVSSSSGFAHGIIVGQNTVHVCYCHSPPRFLWSYHEYVRRERMNKLAQFLVEANLSSLRLWDRVSADRTDLWISTSRVIQNRLNKFYGKDSLIVPPAIDTARFSVGGGEGRYFLMLMRLVGWKRPEIVVQACTMLGLPLVVAGEGRDLAALKAIAGPTVQFVGRVNDEQMKPLYRDCKALILPSEEDFGITPLEAMASGRPVIAYRAGGALDTINPGVNGTFFDAQTPDSLAAALLAFDEHMFYPAHIRTIALQYDSTIFRKRIKAIAENEVERRRTAYTGTLSKPMNKIPVTPPEEFA